jgi:aspartate racemase
MDRMIDFELIQSKGSVAEARGRLLGYARELGGAEPDTAVLLACTELPLAFPEHLFDETFVDDGMTLVNTTTVHAMAAFRRSLG